MSVIFEVIGFLFFPVVLIIGFVFYRRRARDRGAAGIVKTRPNTGKIIALVALASIFIADFIASVILVAIDVFPVVTVLIRLPLEALILVYLCRAIIKERRIGYRRARAHLKRSSV
jgi:hypothetical protein